VGAGEAVSLVFGVGAGLVGGVVVGVMVGLGVVVVLEEGLGDSDGAGESVVALVVGAGVGATDAVSLLVGAGEVVGVAGAAVVGEAVVTFSTAVGAGLRLRAGAGLLLGLRLIVGAELVVTFSAEHIPRTTTNNNNIVRELCQIMFIEIIASFGVQLGYILFETGKPKARRGLSTSKGRMKKQCKIEIP
jgi:hypothetical protein